MRDIASGKADREALKALAPFAKTIDDPWAKGRWLAAILVVVIVEMKGA